jgi:hypothetical protein
MTEKKVKFRQPNKHPRRKQKPLSIAKCMDPISATAPMAAKSLMPRSKGSKAKSLTSTINKIPHLATSKRLGQRTRNILPATSYYTTEELKEVVCMTRKKAMEEAKTKFDAQVQDKLHALEFRNNDAAQELQKVLDMEHLSLQITF